MKKIIESELISIAHRILKLKDKTEIDALYNESRVLFEKISVLKFYEDNKFRIDSKITEERIENVLFDNEAIEIKSTFSKEMSHNSQDLSMSLEIINELIEDSESSEIVFFDDVQNETIIEKTENIIDESVRDEILNIDEIKVENDFSDQESISIDYEQTEGVFETVQIHPVFDLPMEEIIFEKVEPELDESINEVASEEKKHSNIENQHLLDVLGKDEIPFHEIPLNKTINDAFSHMITIGLNDRIAFEKNLFNGSSEDLNRVISQLNTLETFAEAQDFIEDLVKPDFNNWKGKEEYEARFMELIQKRF